MKVQKLTTFGGNSWNVLPLDKRGGFTLTPKLLQAKSWWEFYSVILLKNPIFASLTEAWAKQVPRSNRGHQSLCWTIAGEATPQQQHWERVRKIKSSRMFVEEIRRFQFLAKSLKPIWWKGFGGAGLGAGSLGGSRGFVEARSSRESKTAGWTTSCDSATWIKRRRKLNHLRTWRSEKIS